MRLTATQVLQELNIKNRKVIGWLVERELLPRIVIGPKTFRYESEDVDRLIERVKNEGLLLTIKP